MASLPRGARAQAGDLDQLMADSTTARKPAGSRSGAAGLPVETASVRPVALGAGVLVSHPLALSRTAGGMQLCTDEYARTLRAAGVELAVTPLEHDRRRLTRLVHRLSPQPYPPQWRNAAVRDIITSASRARARFVFLNLVNLAPLAAVLRPHLPAETEIVLLSHGLESVDFLHTIPIETRSRRLQAELGRRLLDERRHRASIGQVLCLSDWEAEIERWIGARHVTAVPRTLPDRPPLEWTPDASRLGFVGTLDHPPNADGLHRFLQAFEPVAPTGCRLRVVGGPVSAGRALAGRFRAVEYLGPLSDADLESEATTWSAFVHPLFCFSRGCSTKLAVALAWRIPIATTPSGVRGYVWREGTLPMAESPEALARLACSLTDRAASIGARDAVAAVACALPTVEDVGRIIHQALAR